MEVTRHTTFEELPEFLSVKEIQAWLGLGRSTAYALLQSKALPVVKFKGSRLLRVPKRALLKYLQTQEENEGPARAAGRARR